MTYIIRAGLKYWFYPYQPQSGYSTWRNAYNDARVQKRKCGAKYYINEVTVGFMFPEIRYQLYLTRYVR
jgi:hypothetical protein